VARWYINLQHPFRIHDQCVDTLDHELDIKARPTRPGRRPASL
jgi:protein associated with RNAse G/E